METTLMSDEEKRFVWNLAFSFTITHRVAAFKAYYAIVHHIPRHFHGTRMHGGEIWRRVFGGGGRGPRGFCRYKQRDEKHEWC